MFSPAQKYLLAQLLEEAFDKLKVVDLCKDTKALYERRAQPKNIKLCQRGWVKTIEQDKPYNNKNKPKDWKVDTCILEGLLKDAAQEMKVSGTYNLIKSFSCTEEEKIKSESTLLDDQGDLFDLADVLQRKLSTQAKSFKQQNQLLSSILDEVTSQHEDCQMMEAIRRRTAKRWETARQRQTAIRLNIAEQDLALQARNYNNKFLEEKTNGDHMAQHLEEALEDLFKQIEEWEIRIDKELEEVELAYQKEQERKKNFERNKMEIEEAYNRMKKTLEEHEENIQCEKELIIMAKASIKIQAWWRGTMVRKKLGPFKPKPKKDKGKKAKKGGKK